MPRMKRKRGAPIGNQNARKHGFYSKVLTPEQRLALPTVAAIKDLDEEIAIARVKLKSVMANAPENYALLFRASSLLARLVTLRSQLNLTRRGHGLPRAASEILDRFVSSLTPQNNSGSK